MMIKLERLRVEGFKRLSGIDLSFPPQCCVLIEGQNEAGKSTLFESIYFALYGDALVKRGSGRGRIRSAIRHGLSEASVALTMSAGDTQLEVKRRIFRDRTNTARLLITYPHYDPETVSGVRAVNMRIIQELNGLDGEALCNSCFVEQKQLDKLEGSSRAKREEVLLKLLDMDRLTDLGKAFKWGSGNDHELEIAKDRLRLVRSACELTKAQERQTQVKYHLKLVAIHIDLDEIDRQREIVQKQSTKQEQQEVRVRRLEKELQRLKSLQSAKDTLESIQGSLSTIANYETEMQRLQGELDELDRLEREEVPARRVELETLETLKDHLNGIKGFEEAQQQAEANRGRLEDILSLADQLEAPKRELEALPSEEKATSDTVENAERRLKAAQTIEALQLWKRACKAVNTLIDADEQIGRTREQAEVVRKRQEELDDHKRRTSKTIAVAVALLLIGLCVTILSLIFASIWLTIPVGMGYLFNPLWLVAAALIVAGVVVGLRGWRQHRYIATESASYAEKLQEYERIVGEQEKRKEVVIEQEPPALNICEDSLDTLEADVPESEEEADAAITVLEEGLGEYNMDILNQALISARSKLQSLAERRNALEAESARVQDKLDGALAKFELPDVEAVRGQIETLQRREIANENTAKDKWEAITGDLRRFELPQEADSALNRVAEQIGKQANEIEKLEERIGKQEELKQKQKEWGENTTGERDKIQNQCEKLMELSEEVGSQIRVPNDDAVLQVLEDIQQALSRMNKRQLNRDLKNARQTAANTRATIQHAESTIDSAENSIRQTLEELDLLPPDGLTRVNIADLEPKFAELSASNQDDLKKQREDLIGKIKSRENEIEKLEKKLKVTCRALDENNCKLAVEELEQRRDICHEAKLIINGVRERMLSQVLPSTISYMQLILPLLTTGRYHYAELDSTSYKMRVWDARAGEQGEYVQKDFFSGGTQDQFSLALRLGFALAALPQELGISPGFIFLDEPLSAFDRQRTNALIKLLTEGEIAKRFDQVFLIAHDRTFETCPFPHYIRLADGRVVDHNLPIRTYESKQIQAPLTGC